MSDKIDCIICGLARDDGESMACHIWFSHLPFNACFCGTEITGWRQFFDHCMDNGGVNVHVMAACLGAH